MRWVKRTKKGENRPEETDISYKCKKERKKFEKSLDTHGYVDV